jgi:hypothetical protein
MKVIPLKFGAMFKQTFSQPTIFNRFVEDFFEDSLDGEIDEGHYPYIKYGRI